MKRARDKILFTPGPLTTSTTVKQAMLRDVGSRDVEFIGLVRDVRRRLLELAGAGQGQGFEALLLQGSGTYGVEAAISSSVPADGKLLALINGAYGARIATIARVHGITLLEHSVPEDQAIDPANVRDLLAADPEITHVAVVHCETTTGLLNPLTEIAAAVREAGRSFLVDAMSSFGAIPIDLPTLGADYVVTSSNKCIEGIPGFAIVLARRSALIGAEGRARTLVLDLAAQWRGLERDGQFRFTPPTHAILAFSRALDELDAEGGVAARGCRYCDNQERLLQGMRALGFRTYLPPAIQGPIITTFLYPDDHRFVFEQFYNRLSDLGFVIYPGKLTQAPCFRIGNIGRIDTEDIDALLAAIAKVLGELGVEN